MTKKICHIIYDDKFTPGYVDFFVTNVPQHTHYFVIFGGKYERLYSKNNYAVYKNIIRINSILKIHSLLKALYISNSSDKIIISGFFGIDKILFIFPKKFWNKTFIHLWGGDYYPYTIINHSLSKRIFKKCLSKCKGLITNDSENQIISKSLNIYKENIDLNMPSYAKDYSYIENDMPKRSKHSFIRILVGNSSTKTNNHIEIFNKISKFKNNNIQIVCPLSYGDFAYRENIIKTGKSIFGNKFIPLTKSIKKYNYINILNNCDIAIFYHERQQAVGNIQFLMKLKKKIYLNNKSPLWKTYIDKGYYVYSLDNVDKENYNAFIDTDNIKLENNFTKIMDQEKKYTEDWISFINN